MSGGSRESLSPFRYADSGADPEAVLAEVRQATVRAANEIADLRRAVVERDGVQLTACAWDMAIRFARGGRLLAFGNGGSSAAAQDLAALFLDPGGDVRPLPALSLAADTAVLTALSDDIGFDVVFARQLGAFGRAGDIAVGLSTSGNSPNLVRAFDEAARRGLLTVGLAGYDGGRMAGADSIDYLFVVPSASAHRVQEAQATLCHALWELTLAELAVHSRPLARARR